MKRNLRKITITVNAQTLYHLKDMANICGHKDLGRIVDKLVREHQMGITYEPSRPTKEPGQVHEEFQKRRDKHYGHF